MFEHKCQKSSFLCDVGAKIFYEANFSFECVCKVFSSAKLVLKTEHVHTLTLEHMVRGTKQLSVKKVAREMVRGSVPTSGKKIMLYLTTYSTHFTLRSSCRIMRRTCG